MPPTPARPALDAMAEEIERLSKEATAAPWHIDRDDRPGMEWNNQVVAQITKRSSTVCFMSHSGHSDNSEAEANVQAITYLRNNAPALVAALRSLADMRGALEECASFMSGVRPITKKPLTATEVMALVHEALARSAP